MQNTSAASLVSLNGTTQSVCEFVLENMDENYNTLLQLLFMATLAILLTI
jgi:uncharacterized membrane protein YqjE